MRDILIKTEEGVFSYRVSGILIHSGRVLLQKSADDDGYAIPGGHVAFGESAEEALLREFKEETGADVRVERLLSVGEIFFRGGTNPAIRFPCTISFPCRIRGRCPRRGSSP